MIYEHAYLLIDPERVDQFEQAVPAARKHLLAAPGCREVSVHRSVDRPSTYLLRVGWDRIEDHLDVFPGTPQARLLAEAIAGYFAQEPTVVHVEGTAL